ncbi:MAG: alanine--tRNA ligase [Elusimicrobiales bacterium]
MKSQEIRAKFLKYFRNCAHTPVNSSPLIPQDPTLLFTSAGMVPLKPYFLGLKTGMSRAVSCQKCFRTTDIERVGMTARHLTFFEMLGNFSFGDYFKTETLDWGWEFLTKQMNIPPDRLYATVYKGGLAPRDEKSVEIWQKLFPKHLRDSHIKELGDDTNFWTMGPTGPCGPCSEIYYDFGPGDYGPHECSGVGCDCDRYIEIWNHVFTQFDRHADGTLKQLPRRNIDTGMGLERLAAAVQGKKTPFATDLFEPIIGQAAGLLGFEPSFDAKFNPATKKPYINGANVIADHCRAAVFLVSEGVTPSNEGRGYVLRRIIRRAVRYGAVMAKDKSGPFLHKLAPSAAAIFKERYPELEKNQQLVCDTIKAEEERFLDTLEAGEKMLQDLFAKCSGGSFPGEEVFHLYETYGFPLELTRELAQKNGIAVDEEGFEKARAKAQQAARANWKGSGSKDVFLFQKAEESFPPAVFTGYNSLSEETTVTGILNSSGEIVDSLEKDGAGYVSLAVTPFYAESGGQTGEAGVITDGKDNIIAVVEDTQRPIAKAVLHKVRALDKISTGMAARATVSRPLRRASACNHTAVHLVNAALRQVMGSGVRQAGSYVSPERFRFDYTSNAAPSREQLAKVEELVNAAVESGLSVCKEERPLAEAQSLGATTLPGEQYADPARFVLINKGGFARAAERFSLELCGGIHADSSGELMTVKILKDSSLSAGVRRIEGVAGAAAIKYLRGTAAIAENFSERFSAGLEEVEKRVERLLKREKDFKREIAELKQKLVACQSADRGGETASGESCAPLFDVAGGMKVIVCANADADVAMLRSLSDKFRKEHPGALVIAASKREDKISFVAAAEENSPADACAVAKALAEKLGGKGGGKKDFAQGGGEAAHWNNFKKLALEAAQSALPAQKS